MYGYKHNLIRKYRRTPYLRSTYAKSIKVVEKIIVAILIKIYIKQHFYCFRDSYYLPLEYSLTNTTND